MLISYAVLVVTTTVYIIMVIALPSQFKVKIRRKRYVEMEHPTEVGFVISGADEFGGHQTKMFKDVIKNHIREVIETVFDSEVEDITYSIAWAHTGRPKKETYEEVTTQITDQNRFLQLTDTFIDVNAPVGQLSTQAGLEHAVEWAEQESNFYSPWEPTELDDFAPKPVDRILIIMSHFDVPGSEVETMLDEQCRTALVYIWVWPDIEQNCDNGRLKKTIKTFANHLNALKYMKHPMSFCGYNKESITQFRDNLLESLHSHFELRQLCYKKHLAGATTIEGEKKDCPEIEGLEVGSCVSSGSKKDCTNLSLWECYPWLLFAAPSGGVITGVMIIIVIVSQIIEYRKRQEEKRQQYSLRSALYIHYQALMGSRSGRCMAAALKATTEKIAAREAQNDRKKRGKDKKAEKEKEKSREKDRDSRKRDKDDDRRDRKDSRGRSKDDDRRPDKKLSTRDTRDSQRDRERNGKKYSDSGLSSSQSTMRTNTLSSNSNTKKSTDSGRGSGGGTPQKGRQPSLRYSGQRDGGGGTQVPLRGGRPGLMPPRSRRF